MVRQVTVYAASGDQMIVDVCDTDIQMEVMSLLCLKQKIAMRLPGSHEANVTAMQLIFAGVRLEGDSTHLAKFGIIHKSVIQMVLFLDGGLAA